MTKLEELSLAALAVVALFNVSPDCNSTSKLMNK